jgi:hypothetical protein
MIGSRCYFHGFEVRSVYLYLAHKLRLLNLSREREIGGHLVRFLAYSTTRKRKLNDFKLRL